MVQGLAPTACWKISMMCKGNGLGDASAQAQQSKPTSDQTQSHKQGQKLQAPGQHPTTRMIDHSDKSFSCFTLHHMRRLGGPHTWIRGVLKQLRCSCDWHRVGWESTQEVDSAEQDSAGADAHAKNEDSKRPAKHEARHNTHMLLLLHALSPLACKHAVFKAIDRKNRNSNHPVWRKLPQYGCCRPLHPRHCNFMSTAM